MSQKIKERGVKPFDIFIKGDHKYVVKEVCPDTDWYMLVKDTYAKEMHYGTITLVRLKELIEEYRFYWEERSEDPNVQTNI